MMLGRQLQLPPALEHAGGLPDPLPIAAAPIALNKTIAALSRYSLLARKEKLLAVHRLVQTVARDRMAGEEASAWAEAAVELVYQVRPDGQRLHEWAAGGQLLPHPESAANLAAEQGIESARLAELDNFIGFYLDFRGDYAAARPYLERALAIFTTRLGPDHPQMQTVRRNLAPLPDKRFPKTAVALIIASRNRLFGALSMRIYLDVCCLNRPFDDQSQNRIRLAGRVEIPVRNPLDWLREQKGL
jgi:hypothetical protein